MLLTTLTLGFGFSTVALARSGPPTCPEEPPAIFGGTCSSEMTCGYGEACCCGECFDEWTFECVEGVWRMSYTDACFFETDCPDESDPPTCPKEPPAMLGTCSGDLSCGYGEECCCGECHDSVTFECVEGAWRMSYTDACSAPNCCELEDGGFLKEGESQPAGDGCNTCTCKPGDSEYELSCTEKACPKDTVCYACDCASYGQQECYYNPHTGCCGAGCHRGDWKPTNGDYTCVQPADPKSCAIEGMKWKGDSLTAGYVQSAAECNENCEDHRACKGWTFDRNASPQKNCVLFRKAGKSRMRRTPGVVSGQRSCDPSA